MDIERLLHSLTDPNIPDDGWVRINEYSDLMSSLKTLEKLFELVKEDVGTWKWIVLCLHNSLQATALCLLTRSDGFGALKDHIEKKIGEFYAQNKNTLTHSDEFEELTLNQDVAPLPILLRRLEFDFPKDDIPPARQDDEQMHYLVKLHNWRNLFAHFPPLEWSAPEQEFIEMTKVVMSLIRSELSSKKWKRAPLITEDELFPLLDSIDARAGGIS